MKTDHNYTYFIPTYSYRLVNLMFGKYGRRGTDNPQAIVSPTILYDFARFVEDFVLSTTLFVPSIFYERLIPCLEEHDPACDTYIINGDQWLTEKVHAANPKFNAFIDAVSEARDEGRFKGDLYHRNKQIAEIANNLEILLEDAVSLNLVMDLPSLFDERLFSDFELDEFTFSNIDNPLALSSKPLLADFLRQAFSHFQMSVSPGVGFINVFKEDNQGLEKQIYSQVERAYKNNISRVEQLLGTHFIYTPPLLTILLDVCESKDDIPQKLCWLRGEFFDLRETINKHEEYLDNAETLKDKLQIVEQLEDSLKILSMKISGTEHKSLIRRMWDISKDKSLWKGFTKLIDGIAEKSKRRHALKRVQRYVDIYDLATNVKQYNKLLSKVFGIESIDAERFIHVNHLKNAVVKQIEPK